MAEVEDSFTSSQTVGLIVEKVPFDITEAGLRNYFEISCPDAPLLDLRLVRSKYSTLHVSYITVSSLAEAETFIRKIDGQLPLSLSVKLRNPESSTSNIISNNTSNIISNNTSNIIMPSVAQAEVEAANENLPVSTRRNDDAGKVVFTYNNPISLSELNPEELPGCIRCGDGSMFVCRKCYQASYCTVACARSHLEQGHDKECEGVTYLGKDWLLQRLFEVRENEKEDKFDQQVSQVEEEDFFKPTKDYVEPGAELDRKVGDTKKPIKVGTRESYISDSEENSDVEFYLASHPSELVKDTGEASDMDCGQLNDEKSQPVVLPDLQQLQQDAPNLNMESSPAHALQPLDVLDKDEDSPPALLEDSSAQSSDINSAHQSQSGNIRYSSTDSDSSDSIPPFNSQHFMEREMERQRKNAMNVEEAEVKKAEVTLASLNQKVTVETQTEPIAKPSTCDVALNCCLKPEETIDCGTQTCQHLPHLLPPDWIHVDQVKSINCGDSQFSFILFIDALDSHKPFFADLHKYTLCKPWDSNICTNLDNALNGSKIFVKRVAKDKNIILMKFENDVSISSLLRELNLIDVSSRSMEKARRPPDSIGNKASTEAKVSEKDKSVTANLPIRPNEKNTIDAHETHDSMIQKVVLQDGVKVLFDDIGDTSQVVKVRCVIEPDRELIEEIMERPVARQVVAEASLGAIVTVRNNDLDNRLPRHLRGEILKISYSKKQVKCKLFDYADQLIVGFEDIFHLPSECWNIPPLCMHLCLTGVPNMPKKEALPKLSKHQYALSKEFVLRVVDEAKKTVELFDERGKSVNELITKILSSEEELPITKSVNSQWNSRLFTEGPDLSPYSHSSYQLLPVGDTLRATVLYVKSPAEFFVCSEEQFRELKQFQTNIQYMACNSIPVLNVEAKVAKVGHMVMFKVDHWWYRGLVTKVSKRTNKVSLFCPDFGFTEKIDMEGMDDRVQPPYCKELGMIKFFAARCQVKEEVKLEDLQTISVKVLSFESLKYVVKVEI